VLNGADFRAADLSGAKFAGALISRAKFEGATGVPAEVDELLDERKVGRVGARVPAEQDEESTE
jgi:hypothetical protein